MLVMGFSSQLKDFVSKEFIYKYSQNVLNLYYLAVLIYMKLLIGIDEKNIAQKEFLLENSIHMQGIGNWCIVINKWLKGITFVPASIRCYINWTRKYCTFLILEQICRRLPTAWRLTQAGICWLY